MSSRISPSPGGDDSPSIDDLAALVGSWKINMQARRLSVHTVDSYLRGVDLYLRWCRQIDTPAAPLSRHTLQSWVTHLLNGGTAPNTACIRQQAVRRFAAWLLAEDEISSDPFVGVVQPKTDTKIVERLSEKELKDLIRACAGKVLHDRRDEAIVRLFAATGMRAGELLALDVGDIDIGAGWVTIRRGKGGKGRSVGIDPVTGATLDRYLRARRHHRLGHTVALWLAETSSRERLGYHGLRAALLGRARMAGIAGFHIHKLRHTFASRWLGAGGSEGGLMSVAGWTSRDMLDRYTRATAADRAADEARRLALGDL